MMFDDDDDDLKSIWDLANVEREEKTCCVMMTP